jgi:hypothetical protein
VEVKFTCERSRRIAIRGRESIATCGTFHRRLQSIFGFGLPDVAAVLVARTECPVDGLKEPIQSDRLGEVIDCTGVVAFANRLKVSISEAIDGWARAQTTRDRAHGR